MIEFEYCNACKTICAVILKGKLIIPKMCKCVAERSGEKWVTDEELIEVFNNMEK